MHNQLLKHCLLFVLSSIFYFGTYSQIGYKQWRNDIISEVNEEQQNVIHCLPRSLNGCNYINNNTFLPNSLYQSSNILHYHDPFNFDPEMIPEWYASHGTPNIFDGVNYPSPLPFTDAGYARMGAWGDDFSDDLLSEGVVQKIPVLTANKEYVLSFFKKIENIAPGAGNTIDNFNIVLMNCADYSQIYTPLYEAPQLPANSQVIYCERLVRNVNWEQVVIKFTANQAYDMIWVFPKQNIGASSVPSVILFSFPELIDPTNFSAGIPPATGNCHVTIGPAPLNCSVRNAVFTWRDPSNNIVYQGPNQHLNLDMGTAPSGTYTLSMSVPSAANITTNGCSLHYPVYSATVNVPAPSCNCTGLQIVLPNVEYWNIQPSGNQNMNFVQDLSTCSLNNLCFGKTDDLPFIFNLSSNQTIGNIWEARIVAVAPFTYGGNAGGTFNNSPIPYPYSGSYYTFGTGQNAQLEMNGFMAPREIFIVEIKLSNSLLGQSKILQIRNVPLSIVYQSDFWCVPYSPAANYPHKVIMGVDALGGNSLDIPGYTYQWTFPQGMTMITGTNNLHVEWDDANFDYINNPNPIASLYVTNIYGCSDFTQVINIAPQYCTSARTPFVNSGNSKERDEGTRFTGKDKAVIFPNPASAIVNISSNGNFVEASIQSGDGRIIGRFLISGRMHQLDVSHLAKGVYLLMLKKRDGTNEVHKIVKH